MRIILTIWLAVMAVLVLGGCKKSSPVGPVAADFKAFDNATPEVKQVWQAALEADHTNDYAKGLTLYYSLPGGDITPEQREAVGRLSTGLNQRLLDAVQKGDAAAQAALQELRQGARNRGR
ncbi:MAG: hypothetical protein WCK27_10420 [Verrucomicrobiota bacterium]|nr:hypothetical protein [Verrucomicrobiota bacterium]